MSIPNKDTVLVYNAWLSQTGTNAPVVTVLRNTIGDLVWTRGSAGEYFGTLTGAFGEGNNTTVMLTNGDGVGAQAIVGGKTDANSVYILSTVDGILTGASLEIKIYNTEN